MRPIRGSERTPMPGARDVGEADPRERLEVSVLLRRKNAQALRDRIKKLERGDRSDGGLSRTAFAERHGSDAGDIAEVKTFAARHGLAVVATDPARRTVILGGTVAQFNSVFGVELRRFEHADGVYRGRTGPVHLPDAAGRYRRGGPGPRQPAASPSAFSQPPAAETVIHAAHRPARPAPAAASTAFTPEATWPNSTTSLRAPPARTSVSRSSSWAAGFAQSDLNTYLAVLSESLPGTQRDGRRRPDGARIRFYPPAIFLAATARSRSTSRWSARLRRRENRRLFHAEHRLGLHRRGYDRGS